MWGPWIYFRFPVRRHSEPWRKTKVFFAALASVLLVMFLWQTVSGWIEPKYHPPARTRPAGSPPYCVGVGNDVGQGAVIDAMVDRDCPQLHGYRVFLYQSQQDYLRAGEPIPPGMQFPWCAVLHENPCLPTPDVTTP